MKQYTTSVEENKQSWTTIHHQSPQQREKENTSNAQQFQMITYEWRMSCFPP